MPRRKSNGYKKSVHTTTTHELYDLAIEKKIPFPDALSRGIMELSQQTGTQEDIAQLKEDHKTTEKSMRIYQRRYLAADEQNQKNMERLAIAEEQLKNSQDTIRQLTKDMIILKSQMPKQKVVVPPQ